MHETAAEERRFQAERKAAAKAKGAERKAEEKGAEVEERKLPAERKAKERKTAVALERLKLELEAKRLETAARPAEIAREVIRRSARITRSPELPAFVDGRDNLDNWDFA